VLLLAVRRAGRGRGAGVGRMMSASSRHAAVMRRTPMGMRPPDLGKGEGSQEQQSEQSDGEAAGHY